MHVALTHPPRHQHPRCFHLLTSIEQLLPNENHSTKSIKIRREKCRTTDSSKKKSCTKSCQLHVSKSQSTTFAHLLRNAQNLLTVSQECKWRGSTRLTIVSILWYQWAVSSSASERERITTPLKTTILYHVRVMLLCAQFLCRATCISSSTLFILYNYESTAFTGSTYLRCKLPIKMEGIQNESLKCLLTIHNRRQQNINYGLVFYLYDSKICLL